MEKKSKILLVDDEEIGGTFLQKKLSQYHFECDFVTNHKDCYIHLEKQHYDLVLLDIMMPEVSGIEILEKIRETQHSWELPIIMATAKGETTDVVDALKKGANDYLKKPVNMDIAIARINTQLQIKKLFFQSLKNKQVQTINTMMTTLNHQINNPLAIAMGNLSLPFEKIDPSKVEKAMNALSRITEIVKKIEAITKGDIEEIEYSAKSTMYKV